jgi:hypothetical protein
VLATLSDVAAIQLEAPRPAFESLPRGRQRFFLTVIVTGVLVVVAPALSVARAVSV